VAIITIVVIFLVVFLAIRLLRSGSSTTTEADEGPFLPRYSPTSPAFSPAVLAALAPERQRRRPLAAWPNHLGVTTSARRFTLAPNTAQYCAVEPLAVDCRPQSLGTFKNLAGSFSASDDELSLDSDLYFRGSSYDSQYLTFSPVEVQGNKRVGGSTRRSKRQRRNSSRSSTASMALPSCSGSGGGIPFIDIADRYMVDGSTYDRTCSAALTALPSRRSFRSADNDTAKGILGAANRLTAAICVATANQPADVCGQARSPARAKTCRSSRLGEWVTAGASSGGVAGKLRSRDLNLFDDRPFQPGTDSLAMPSWRSGRMRAVTTSAASMVGPIPIAALGILWFSRALILASRPMCPVRPGRSSRARLVGAGLVAVFYLLYVELLYLGRSASGAPRFTC